MSNPRVDFLYLDESDMVKAGVNDMHACVETMCEVFELMGKGDYVMGGKNHNSHGILISFPEHPEHEGMPHDGPDRRFMAMTAYLGGRFHIAGEKWYGSNRDNLEKGLPRSILMVMLNDVDTGAPVAFMSGNLISGIRTGAIPGVGAKYLAKKDSKVCGLIAAGAISRCCFMSLIDVCKEIDTVKIYDVFPAASEKLAAYIKANYPQVKTIEICDSIEACVKDADVINVATSGKVNPRIEEAWLKPGAYISCPASIDMDPDFVLHRCKPVVDNWLMYEAWMEEMEPPYASHGAAVGYHFLDWVDAGMVKREDIVSLGDIIAGRKSGRVDDKEITIFGMGGMPVYDVAWGYACYEKAKEMGLGKSLNLWEKPYLA